jgi:hypothetical protein
MSTNEETLRTEAEARRAMAGRPITSRYADRIAQYLAAYDYAARALKERERREHGDREREEVHHGDPAATR